MQPTSAIDRARTCQSEIIINAPQQIVWDILVDLERYAEWSTFVYESEPLPSVGGIFRIQVKMRDGYSIDLPTKLFSVKPPHLIVWSGQNYPDWVVNGIRYQKLTSLSPIETRYQSWETFRGVLGFIAKWTQGADVQRGFDETAVTLKARAEQFYLAGNAIS